MTGRRADAAPIPVTPPAVTFHRTAVGLNPLRTTIMEFGSDADALTFAAWWGAAGLAAFATFLADYRIQMGGRP